VGAGLALKGAQVAGGEAVRDKIARRIANIGHAPGFEGEVAAGIGGKRCGGVGQSAAGRVDPSTHDHALELGDVASGVLRLQKCLEVPNK